MKKWYKELYTFMCNHMFTHKFIEKCVRENEPLKALSLPPEPKYKNYQSTFVFLVEKLFPEDLSDISKKRFEMAQEFEEYYQNFAYHREMKQWLSKRGMKTRMREVIGELSSTHVSQYLSVRSFEFLCKWFNLRIQYGICVFNPQGTTTYNVEFVEKNDTIREKENNTLKDKPFSIHSFESPLCVRSSYKKSDLLDIVKYINLNECERITKMTKSELYDYLWMHLHIYSKIKIE
jgi:hypothetical protein